MKKQDVLANTTLNVGTVTVADIRHVNVPRKTTWAPFHGQARRRTLT